MSEKILLIDDEVDFLSAMSERMKARDMQVTTASSAKEGLEKVSAESFDAVILDLAMPEMDGIETLKILKEKNPDLQVILLTGHATIKQGIEAMKLGALDLLEKPADINALTAKIKTAQARKMLIVEKKNEETIRKIMATKGW
ncbi:response regulator [Desulfoprunum benzoelyticum]|uniref:DNA-binding NtrC family response regulator n=1 Tax=Desulfoprunum benzoelyticum TaxID=1506996 RepID=A0A840V540_9BACT|nr:response regulator [Desulfoprunum benzoelyticum]MBB5348859.1 DNA-binding NtrC family response regulator [Desulfoprunum benzoelyticum]MBM9530099.1 response regulator [Desulfoprunum benzoelyticum]